MFEIIPRNTLNPFVSFNPFREMEEFEKSASFGYTMFEYNEDNKS